MRVIGWIAVVLAVLLLLGFTAQNVAELGACRSELDRAERRVEPPQICDMDGRNCKPMPCWAGGRCE